jgi:hypothetical protein
MTLYTESQENENLRQRFLHMLPKPEGVREFVYDPAGIMLFEHAMWIEASHKIPLKDTSYMVEAAERNMVFACACSPPELYGRLMTHPIFVMRPAFAYAENEVATRLIHHEGTHVRNARDGLCIGDLLIDEEQRQEISQDLFIAADEYIALSEELAHFPEETSPRYRTNFRMQLSEYFGIISKHQPTTPLETEIQNRIMEHNMTVLMPLFMAHFAPHHEEDQPYIRRGLLATGFLTKQR